MMPFSALLLGSGLVIAVADRVPTLNVEPSCRGAASAGLGTGRTVENCVNGENTARNDLVKNWGQFSASDKGHCLSMISTGGPPSYVELLSCLEMSRDAKTIARGQSLGDAPTTPRQGPAHPQPRPR